MEYDYMDEETPHSINGEPAYEVEEVLDMRLRGPRRKKKREFLIKWVGYGPEHNSWEPRENLNSCPDALVAFFLKRGIDDDEVMVQYYKELEELKEIKDAKNEPSTSIDDWRLVNDENLIPPSKMELEISIEDEVMDYQQEPVQSLNAGITEESRSNVNRNRERKNVGALWADALEDYDSDVDPLIAKSPIPYGEESSMNTFKKLKETMKSLRPMDEFLALGKEKESRKRRHEEDLAGPSTDKGRSSRRSEGVTPKRVRFQICTPHDDTADRIQMAGETEEVFLKGLIRENQKKQEDQPEKYLFGNKQEMEHQVSEKTGKKYLTYYVGERVGLGQIFDESLTDY
ncbi:unnamed protein product [Bursaphelenchus okinawaensis]|uniref:Chromo domain-containing protein n=1 Tax=Bursaphelenchus okinawaensis TaxID=465554 RepID=A0A811KTP4_9BILA|nr:unnamed protein product [Bursaphelenchus okinawaensis]CAG9112220.1 unnamed protein product [Bursaphelenchus okinawaensis]